MATPDDLERLRRIADAAERALIHDHAVGDLSNDTIADLYGDAVRLSAWVIAEAVAGLPAEVRRADPRIPWSDLAGLRDRLAPLEARAVRAVVRAELPDVPARVRALSARSGADGALR